jgi:V/A-type H+/Na+-transporting ATPase subunit I
MKNTAAIKPFEVIVNMFGTPKYREWDPTPITAYSFAIFFGLMLCDVAYAIGIILAARFLIRKFVDDPHSEGYRLFQRVLYVSGGVALVLGLLAGNYLGDVYTFLGVDSAALVEPVRQMLSDPIDFIVLSIVIGLVHVNIAHLMALIVGVRQRDKGLVINKISLFALQISIIPIILRWLFSVSLPISQGIYDILMYVVGGSVVGIIISSFMQRGGLGAIFWIFDMTGILGDVMSYARLAGVGLATFYLAASFNMLAQLFSGLIPGVIGVIIGTAIAVVVMLLGHLINLALSGIGCFVHSLRLCFVEFLSKFYEGGGEQYSPFRLRTRLVSAK